LVLPPVLITRLPIFSAFARKYVAYIDKLIILPVWLFLFSHRYDLVHIADHGNAFYSFFCPSRHCVVTCHDRLAVRAAFGDSTVACNTSPIGIWLQRLIIAGLRRPSALAFVSDATFADFKRLIGCSPSQRYSVIPSPLNAPFNPSQSAFELSDLEQALLPPRPYLLMAGSASPRKNRGLALKLLKWMGESSPYCVVFAGDPFSPAEQAFHDSHPLGIKLLSIPRPSHSLLNFLYCQAHALLFPSIAEGFGWPLLEAQACRCPVIASRTTSIPEVAGDGALYAEPADVGAFASHVLTLEDPVERGNLIRLGLTNICRYDPEKISESYRYFAFKY
jgi:glycosyltransferase involved in cell wall biosynthesis